MTTCGGGSLLLDAAPEPNFKFLTCQIRCATKAKAILAMRVLFWSGTFWPQIGGVEVLAAEFLPTSRARGYDYVVVTPKSFADLPDVSYFEGIPVYRFLFQNSLIWKS